MNILYLWMTDCLAKGKNMNKRARRAKVMAERYAKVDQRKQQSESMKRSLKRQDAMIKFILNYDHPMARIARELTGDWKRGNYDAIMQWHKDNPELSVQMKAYMEQAKKDFRESHK